MTMRPSWLPTRPASKKDREARPMSVLLSGDMTSDRGPARVNKSLASHADWLRAPLDRPQLRLVRLLLSGRYQGALISSLSVRHVALLVVGRLTGRPVWFLAHGVAVREGSARFSRRSLIEWLSVRLSRKVVCVSQVLADDLRRIYGGRPGRYCVVALAGEDGPAPERRSSVNVNSSDTRAVEVLTVGTAPIKNVDAIIEACRRFSGPHQLTVIGSVSSMPPGVRVIPSLQHDELLELMMDTDIYVQASHHEPFGLAITEAATAGCEVLVPVNAGATPHLTELNDWNVIEDVTDVTEIARKLEVLSRRVRRGTAQMHMPVRTWADAAGELKTLLAQGTAGASVHEAGSRG
jgi:hypothetical protein